MKTIVVANNRGGSGKTTTVQAYANGLAALGNKVLVIDLDPQGNTTDSFKADNQDVPTAYELLSNEATAAQAIQHKDKVDIIPSDKYLGILERKMDDLLALKKSIADVTGYDYLIIDTNPSINMLMMNALAAADHVIIPIQAERYSLMGLNELYENIQDIKKVNPDLNLDGILLTRFTDQANLNKQLREALDGIAKQGGTRLFKTVIHEGIKVKEAQMLQEDLLSYAPKSRPAQDYKAFIEEWLEG